MTVLDGLLADHPRRVQALVLRAECLLVQKRPEDEERAIADLTKAFELGARTPHVYFIRAVLRANRGDTKGALEDAEEAARRAPREAKYRNLVESLKAERR